MLIYVWERKIKQAEIHYWHLQEKSRVHNFKVRYAMFMVGVLCFVCVKFNHLLYLV